MERLATRRVKGANAAIPIDSGSATATSIFAREGSPVIAVNDGKIVALGHNRKLGRYLKLQDATGNVYTYADLGSIPQAVSGAQAGEGDRGADRQAARPNARRSRPARPARRRPGSRPGRRFRRRRSRQRPEAARSASVQTTKRVKVSLPQTRTAAQSTAPGGVAKERLFADPSRPASFAAGGNLQIRSEAQAISSFQNYFSDVLHLAKNQYTLRPLKVGAIVVAGTILGPRRRPVEHHREASGVHGPAGRQGRAADRPETDPRRLEAAWKRPPCTARPGWIRSTVRARRTPPPAKCC